ncbi:TolC family outer membrane protein [Candidatus Vondammii sp. HM_W22]|uniref:TolC family outer membrane protein n=1 Tax=Candidatus Vondammii sp. HM_W22 TaxID=2687299 RepID=UPI002E7C1F04|nr:TolC family outer membrane protein [Candidatus Vondammii sp. HM_W22]
MKMKLLTLSITFLIGISQAHGGNLLQAYQLAEQNDAQLRAARAVRDSALEAKPQAKALLLPSASLSASANRIHSDVKGGSENTYGRENLTVSLSQPVYHRDYFIKLEQADKQIAQAEVTFAAEEQGLIVRVAQAYFDVLSATDSLEFAQSENKAIERQLDQAKQRFEVGLIAITSVHETQAAYDQTRADLILAENEVDNAKEAMREITKEPFDTFSPVVADLPLSAPEPQNIDQWGESAMAQNLTIQAARYATEIARQNIQVQRSGYYPTVDLVGSHALDRNDSSFGSDADTTTIGLQLNMPLYTGGAVGSRTRQARFDYQAAQENMDKQVRSVNRQVRDGYRGVLASISAVDALKASTVSAKSALEATEAGLEVGTRTTVDVLSAQRDLFRALSNYSTVRFNYILSSLRLKQAAGSLSKTDLEQVNEWLKK